MRRPSSLGRPDLETCPPVFGDIVGDGEMLLSAGLIFFL